jgi:hypothetical protein
METTIFTHQQPSVPKKQNSKKIIPHLWPSNFTLVEKHKNVIHALYEFKIFHKRIRETSNPF